MKRISIPPRDEWREKVERLGLLFHTEPRGVYWNESAYYELTEAEAKAVEIASRELHTRCLDAIQYVIDNKRYADLKISDALVPAIEWAWEAEPPSIYGRFDFALVDGVPKLLEYNADTPTTLLESAVVQWHWLQEVLPGRTQFNGIWEALVEYWTWCRKNDYLKGDRIHFASGGALEDVMTVATLQDAAKEAGFVTEMLEMADIGWDGRRFVDLDNRAIRTIFKLYPWEWMLRENFARPLMQTYKEVQWIEPIWKALLSNKAILALLWEMFPQSEYLLPTYLDGPRDMLQYVKKPIFGREGANISIVGAEGEASLPGTYGREGFVWQGFAPLPDFGGNRPIIGSWIVDAEPVGIGIRESDGPITGNLSRFVPHAIG